MPDFWWQTHADLLHVCALKAQDLLHAVTAAVSRVIMQDNRALSGANHAVIVEKYDKLNICQDFAREVQCFCAKMAARKGGCGGASPFDTEPAERSEYAWIPRVEGKTPVSPMRAMWQLQSALEKGIRDVTSV